MFYLYGSKPGVEQRLVATFDSEQQLLSYVRWATLSENPDRSLKFEQGSALVGYTRFDYAQAPPTTEPGPDIPHNPSPSML